MSGLALSHYSDYATLTPYCAAQVPASHTFEKPHGLWVSVDNEYDWAQWCAENKFRDTGAQYRHRVVLAPEANVLHVATVEQLHAFDDTYSRPDPILPSHRDMRGIDWAAVAEHYQGIIISPYQWSQRLGGIGRTSHWYYPWDCASGCIWDAAAIKETQLVQQEDTGTTRVSENA